MKKRDVIARVSEKSGVGAKECERVLDALEDVLGEELGESRGLGGALDKIHALMQFLKERKMS